MRYSISHLMKCVLVLALCSASTSLTQADLINQQAPSSALRQPRDAGAKASSDSSPGSSSSSGKIASIISTVDGQIHAINSDNEQVWSTALPGGSLAKSHTAEKAKVSSVPGSGSGSSSSSGSSLDDDLRDRERDPFSDEEEEITTNENASTNGNGNGNGGSSRPYSVIPTIDGSVLVHTSEGMRKTSVKARMLGEYISVYMCISDVYLKEE